MPNDGATFGVLTTGSVANGEPPNSSPSRGTDNGQASRNVRDLSVLKIDVAVPATSNCLSFDLVFYSEEYPEFVGSVYNDGFVAELDTNSWTYDPESTSIDAPSNFAFDENHNLLTINSASFMAEGGTSLEYDGSTQLLTAATPIAPGAHSIYLSVFDAGDGIYDTAVFLDNLRTESVAPEDCTAGARTRDTDGDALPDVWETDGYNPDGDSVVDLDLPAMGADPEHKDVFVELDAMKGLRLSQSAIDAVVDSFAAAPVSNPDGSSGIALHVDNGPNSVMNPRTGEIWGAASRASDIGFIPALGFFQNGSYNWSAFDTLKANLFSSPREPVFHYAFSVNRLGNEGFSGISRGIGASDFLVSLGMRCNPEGACPGPVKGQAGTFMHELGHNLGLRHGGLDNVNHKPNYLSVMNYSFQFPGLFGGGVDYSRFSHLDIPDLDEDDLDEGSGFNTSVTGMRTLINCDGGFFHDDYWSLVNLAGPVDFNCDFDFVDSDESRDLNREGGNSLLQSFDDWQAAKLKGGAIGGEGLAVLLPEETESNEVDVETIQEAAEAVTPPPLLSVGAVTGITASRADVHATVNPNGRPVEIAVQYGRTAGYGNQTPFSHLGGGNAPLDVTVPIAPLSGGDYHYQVIARTPEHLVYSADGFFSTDQTSAPPPQGPSFTPPAQAASSKPVLLLSSVRLARRLLSEDSGLTLRFLVSRAARITMVVQRRAARTKRWVKAASLSRFVRAGANTVRLQAARLELVPGRYRVLLEARAEDGGHAVSRGLPFRVSP